MFHIVKKGKAAYDTIAVFKQMEIVMKTMFLSLILFLSGGVFAQGVNSEAQLKKLPSVKYPAEARKTGLEGTVSVPVDVDETGKVTKVGEAYGPGFVCPSVDRADVVAMRTIASKAAEKAVFVPAMQDGKAVSSQMSVQFEFKDPSKKSVEKSEYMVSLGESKASVKTAEPNDNNARASETPRMTMKLGGISSPVVDEKPPPSSTTIDTKSISGGVLNGKAILLPKPAYPAAAKAVKATGMVIVQVTIDTSGVMFSAEPISGHPLLRASARNAACSSRFAPTLLEGKPVLVVGVITYNFMK